MVEPQPFDQRCPVRRGRDQREIVQRPRSAPAGERLGPSGIRARPPGDGLDDDHPQLQGLQSEAFGPRQRVDVCGGQRRQRRGDRCADVVAGSVAVGDDVLDLLDRPVHQAGGSARQPAEERHLVRRRRAFQLVGRAGVAEPAR